MSTDSLLRMQDISMRFDDELLFSGVSFTLKKNETIGITGPSGSGKSTLLRIAVNLLTPSTGDVEFKGKPVTEWNPRLLRRHMTLVPQQATMFPGTVRENLEWGLKIHGLEATEEELEEIMGEVRLESKQLVRTAENMSGGEKQRIAIARALVLKPDVLLLDEPTSALDEDSTLAVETTVSDVIKERNIGVLIVTHNKAQGERFTDRIIEIKDGENS